MPGWPFPLPDALGQIIEGHRPSGTDKVMVPFGSPAQVKKTIKHKNGLKEQLEIAGVGGESFYQHTYLFRKDAPLLPIA